LEARAHRKPIKLTVAVPVRALHLEKANMIVPYVKVGRERVVAKLRVHAQLVDAIGRVHEKEHLAEMPDGRLFVPHSDEAPEVYTVNHARSLL